MQGPICEQLILFRDTQALWIKQLYHFACLSCVKTSCYSGLDTRRPVLASSQLLLACLCFYIISGISWYSTNPIGRMPFPCLVLHTHWEDLVSSGDVGDGNNHGGFSQCHLNFYESSRADGDLSVVRKCRPSRWWKIGRTVWAIRSICSEFVEPRRRAAEPGTWTAARWDWHSLLTLARCKGTARHPPSTSFPSYPSFKHKPTGPNETKRYLTLR